MIGALRLMDRFPVLKSIQSSAFEVLSNKRLLSILTIVPALGLFLFVTVIPIGWTIFGGFHEIPLFSPEWEFIGLQHYRDIITNSEFWASMRRSVIFAAGSVSLQLVAGTAIALLIHHGSWRAATTIRGIVFLPYFIPTAVVGFVALWVGNTQWGLVNQLLVASGLVSDPVPWFGSKALAMPAVIVANSWKFTIFVTIMVLARLQSIPEGFYEAAEMAGANSYQVLRDITLPNIKNVVVIVLLLRGIWMFNKFDIIFVLTAGGPNEATTTAPIYAYRVAFVDSDLGRAAAISTTLFVMLAAIALFYFYYFQPEEEVRVE